MTSARTPSPEETNKPNEAARAGNPPSPASVLNALSQAVITTDLQGVITFWNPGAEALFGWASSEVVGRSILDLTAPNLSREEVASIRSTLTNGNPWSGEVMVQRSDGSRFPAFVEDRPIVGDSGDVIGIVRTSVDITERRRSEQTLATHYAVGSILAEATDLRQAIPLVLQAIGERWPWDWGAFWAVGHEGSAPRCTETWSQQPSSARRDHELDAADGPALSGWLADAWSSGEPVWRADITSGPATGRARRAIDAGMRSALAVPIVIDGRISAVIEFLSRESREPDHRMLTMMTVIGGRIGQFADRVRAEARRAQFEAGAKFHDLLETAPDAILTVDAAGSIVLVNDWTEQLFGYSRDELIGQPIELLMPEQFSVTHRQHRFEYAARPRTRPMGIGLELVGRRRDGTELPVEISLSPLAAGDELLVTAIVRDISQRKRAEEQIRQSRLQLAEAQQIAKIGSWEWDIPNNVVNWSDEMYRIYGLRPGEFTTSFEGFLERVHPQDRDHTRAEIEAAFIQHRAFEFEHRIVRPDEAELVIHARGEVVLDDGGQPVRMIGTGQDITERKEAEARLHQLIREQAARAESEAAQGRLAFLAEASAELSSSLDYGATPEKLAQLAVPRIADWCSITVIGPDGQFENLARAHVDPDMTAAAEDLWQRYPDDPNARYGIPNVLRTGASEIYASISDDLLAAIARDEGHLELLRRIGFRSVMVVPLRARDEILGVLTLGSAESGRRFTEVDLSLAEDLAQRAALAIDNARLYREAREAAQLREEFLSIAAHELRTPLTTMKGYVQLQRRYLAQPELNRERLDLAAWQLQEQTARIERLTQDLLDVSRIQKGGLILRPDSMDLAALIREIVERLAQSPERSDRHTLVIDAQKPVVGFWDKDRLDQVLTNLLTNALKYSPDGGEVLISVSLAEGWVSVAVADQGVGIPQEEQTRLFQPFTRGELARQHIGGAGLGLYIAAQIVARHGGQINVNSAPGQGSTFTFSLPLS